MIYDRFAQGLNTLPLIAPVDTAATAIQGVVKLGGSHGGTAFVFFGANTAASADQAVTVTVEAATSSASTTAEAVAFNYRLSGAVGANSWGDVTAATSAGVSVAISTDDNKMLAIDIDPSKFLAAKADCTHIRIVVTPNAGATATLVSAWAQLEPRYSQKTMVSAT